MTNRQFSDITSILRIRLLVVIALVAVGCSAGATATPSLVVRQDDLVGAWEVSYPSPKGKEVLVLREDSSFIQIYQEENGHMLTVEGSPWSISQEVNGRWLLALDSGLWFAGGLSVAQLNGMDALPVSGSHVFYDPLTGGGIRMVDKVVIQIVGGRNRTGIALISFPYDIDSQAHLYQPLVP